MENIRKIVAAESRRFLRFQFLFFLVLFASTLLYRSISLFMENKKLGDGIIAYFAPLMLLLLLFALEARSRTFYRVAINLHARIRRRSGFLILMIFLLSMLIMGTYFIFRRPDYLKIISLTQLVSVISLAVLSIGAGLLLRACWSSSIVAQLKDAGQVALFVVSTITIFIFPFLFVFYSSNSKLGALGLACILGPIGFIAQHFREMSITRTKERNDSAAVDDPLMLHEDSEKPPSTSIERLRRYIIDGQFVRASLILPLCICLSRTPESKKDIVKATCRLLFRKRMYRAVNILLLLYEKKYGILASDTLISLKALARLERGDILRAKMILTQAISSRPVDQANPFHLLNLSYVYEREGNFDQSLELLDRVLETKEGSDCPLALNNKAYILTEITLIRHYRDETRMKQIIQEAKSAINRAMQNPNSGHISHIEDTKGLIHLVLGEYSAAIDCFSRVADTSAAAQFHLGLFFMMGTKDYIRAEYFLRSALYQTSRKSNPWFYGLIRFHLDLVSNARRDRLTCGPGLIFSHLKDYVEKLKGVSNKIIYKNNVTEGLEDVLWAKRMSLLNGLSNLFAEICMKLWNPELAPAHAKENKRGLDEAP